METASLFVRPRPVLSQAIEACIRDGSIQSTLMHLKSGDMLFRSGDNIRRTFYISRGLVKLYSENGTGDTKTVFLHKAGTLIGFQTLQRTDDDVYPSILNAQATAACDIYALNATQFKQFLSDSRRFFWQLPVSLTFRRLRQWFHSPMRSLPPCSACTPTP